MRWKGADCMQCSRVERSGVEWSEVGDGESREAKVIGCCIRENRVVERVGGAGR